VSSRPAPAPRTEAPPEARCPICGEIRPLLSINAAAWIAGVSRKTIYRWIKAGRLQTCELPSGMKRILPESLIRQGVDRAGARRRIEEVARAAPLPSRGGSRVAAAGSQTPPE
jgi:hypothetical protein